MKRQTGVVQRGMALLRDGRPAEAVAVLRRAVTVAPGDAEVWCALGDALHKAGALDDACRAYRQAVAHDAERFAAWWGLGCALARMREPAQAAPALERAVALRPDQAMAWHNLGRAWYELGRIEDAIDAMRRAAALAPGSPIPLRGVAMAIPGDPRADAAAIRDARRAWAACELVETVPAELPAAPDDTATRRLRIGYLSAYFRNPNYMKPVWALVNRHRRDRFEVVLVSDNPRDSVDPAYVAHADDDFVSIEGLDNTAATARIAALGLDVLVDLNGYSAPERLGVVAARPARRVVAWFNSFATSGLDAYDALIADPVVAPADAGAGSAATPEFEEPLLRLPFCHLTFEVSHAVPDVAPPPSLARGALTFGCLSPVYKIVAGVVEAQAVILKACEGSRLLVKSSALHSAAACELLRQRFAAHGVPAEALILEGPAEHFRFLEAYAQVDVALDTFPYGGATTTTEGLWQGVPTVTFAGSRWAGRLGASVMHYAGLDEFIVGGVEGYVARAIELHRDPATPQRLAVMRASMRERLRGSRVCEAAGFAASMEHAFESIVQAPPRRA